MIWFLLLFLHVNDMVAPTNPTESQSPAKSTQSIDLTKKPVMCTYKEPNSFWDKDKPKMQPESIPCECELILVDGLIIDIDGKITANNKVIKWLASQRPVLVVFTRGYGYGDWSIILNSDGNQTDANILIKFAKSHNILGYLVQTFYPLPFMGDVLNQEVSKNIVTYLQQLKYSPEFIVGVTIGHYGSMIKNPCVTDFEALNKIVDFYEIDTSIMNTCIDKNEEVINDRSPVKLVPHGPNYLSSLEEVSNILHASKCDLEKVYFIAEVYPKDSTTTYTYDTYSVACKANNKCKWCLPRTQDSFDKGVFLKQQKYGMNVRFVNCDDVENTCGCEPFVMTRNIVAGYYGKEQIPCDKIDADRQC